MALALINPMLLLSPLILLVLHQHTASGQYMVEILEQTAIGGHRAVVRCDATGANFGEDVVSFSFGMGSIGCAMMTDPTLACSDVEKPQLNSTKQCIVDFAVVPRGNCSFSEKAYYVQNAKPTGYNALIVYNAKGQNPIPMSGSKFAELIQIPVVMVKYECMQSMLGHYSAEHGYMVTIKPSPGYYDLVKYLFPFVIIVGICFIVLFISLMIRLCRERRRLARKRLPRSYLKKIPTKKYKKGDPEETCAICLEDFQETEKLRILPCKHAYHCKCIDPWLTKNRKVCPVCKRRVGPRSEDSSDTDDTDTERATRSTVSSTEPSSSTTLMLSNRDNDPLLRNAQPIATTSSQEFPYPQAPSLQQQPSTSATNAFMRARNFLHLSNIFHPSRCELNTSSSTLPAVVTSTTTNGGNSTATTFAFTELRQTALLHSSPELEDLSAAGQQHTTTGSATVQSTGNGSSAFGRVRSGFAGFGSRLAGLIRRNGSEQNNPHLLLENEEDASTLSREELDTLSRRTCDTLDEANNSSTDGHSMTTMHSNRNLFSVAVELDPSAGHNNTTVDNAQQVESGVVPQTQSTTEENAAGDNR